MCGTSSSVDHIYLLYGYTKLAVRRGVVLTFQRLDFVSRPEMSPLLVLIFPAVKEALHSKRGVLKRFSTRVGEGYGYGYTGTRYLYPVHKYPYRVHICVPGKVSN